MSNFTGGTLIRRFYEFRRDTPWQWKIKSAHRLLLAQKKIIVFQCEYEYYIVLQFWEHVK